MASAFGASGFSGAADCSGAAGGTGRSRNRAQQEQGHGRGAGQQHPRAERGEPPGPRRRRGRGWEEFRPGGGDVVPVQRRVQRHELAIRPPGLGANAEQLGEGALVGLRREPVGESVEQPFQIGVGRHAMASPSVL